jgi:hypothetical protein
MKAAARNIAMGIAILGTTSNFPFNKAYKAPKKAINRSAKSSARTPIYVPGISSILIFGSRTMIRIKRYKMLSVLMKNIKIRAKHNRKIKLLYPKKQIRETSPKKKPMNNADCTALPEKSLSIDNVFQHSP